VEIIGDSQHDQKRGRRDLFKPMTASEQKKMDEETAYFIYSTGSALSLCEHPSFIKYVKLLNPAAATVPSQRRISGTLLNDCFDKGTAELEHKISTCGYMTLGTVTQTNVNGQSIINYVGMNSESFHFLLNSKDTESESSHTAESLKEDYSLYIERYKDRVAGGVTDNTSANRSMWRELSSHFPELFFYGCHCHNTHLLVQMIFKTPTSTSSSSSLYPLQEYATLVDHAMEVCKFFGRGVQKQFLIQDDLSAENDSHRCLKLSCESRWGSIQVMLTELLNKLSTLSDLVSTNDWTNQGSGRNRERRQLIHDFILDPTTRSRLKTALEILSPIERAGREQSNNFFLSDVHHQWRHLETAFDEIADLSAAQRSFIKEKVADRWEFLRQDCHVMAYLLDPRYGHLENISRGTRDPMVDTLFSYLKKQHPNKPPEDIELEIVRYLHVIDAESDLTLRVLRRNDRTVLKWWRGERRSFPILSAVAVRIFSLVSSTAAVERSFQRQETIHKKLRAHLTEKICQKLTFIRMNPTLYDRNCSNHESILSMMDPDSISSDSTNDLDEEVTEHADREFYLDPHDQDQEEADTVI
jgi:hypothetical protein